MNAEKKEKYKIKFINESIAMLSPTANGNNIHEHYANGRIKGIENCLIMKDSYLIMIEHLKRELSKSQNVDEFLESVMGDLPDGYIENTRQSEIIELMKIMIEIADDYVEYAIKYGTPLNTKKANEYFKIKNDLNKLVGGDCDE